MEIVKAFNNNELHTEIVIKGTIENPLFRACDVGEILEMTNIRVNIQNFDETEKIIQSCHTEKGQQNVSFLTEKGLYKILFRSRKPIAEEFQNWICDIIKEIRLKGAYNLQKQLDLKNDEMMTQIHRGKQSENERVLLDKFSNIGSIIYIIKVKTFEDGSYVIKIGESRKGIQLRYAEHKKNYDECLLLDCFQVNKSREFENMLHHDKLIRPNKVTNLENHERENELFLIGHNLTYQMVLKIIDDNIDNYNYSVRELLLENELLQIKKFNESKIDHELFKELIESNKILTEKVVLLENTIQMLVGNISVKKNTHIQENDDIPLKKESKLVTGFGQQIPNLGPRLQKINPETMKLVQVYECVSDAMNENKDIKRPSITKAINENTVYCGFRWLLVERNSDPNVVHSIEPTKQILEKNSGYIAKLNSDKSEILNVYLDRKTSALLNNYQSLSALDNPVKNESMSQGNYYILYKKCSRDLVEKFEEKYGEPILYKDGIGQYDLNDNLIREFKCKYDCIREMKMSDKTLRKSTVNKIPYNGYYYREIGEKLCMC
jgi:prophage antirepressor-like protein